MFYEISDSLKKEEWLGTNIEDLYVDKDPWRRYVQPLESSVKHSVLFIQPVRGSQPPQPSKALYNDIWNSALFINMPFYTGNVYFDNKVSYFRS